MREPLKRTAFRLGVGRPLRAARRALFEPDVERRDREDNELVFALMADELAPDSSAIDVGAHDGAVLGEILRLAPDGRHVAFEPLPRLAARLAERFPQVTVRATALSDRPGEREFVHVRSRPGWSSFRSLSYPGHERLETIAVRAERLDDALPEGFVPAFVKVDVNGAEREALAGGLKTLSQHRPVVVFEHGLGSADHYGTEPRHMWELLVERAALRIFSLEGQGPYSPERFAREFREGVRVNFVARP